MQQGYIFDLDGTVYLDDKVINGAVETIRTLKERGDKIVFFTNKSIQTTASYVQKLNTLGIEAQKENVINSNLLVAKYLTENLNCNEKVMIIGEDPLVNEITSFNIKVSDNPDEVKYVVLGWDRKFTYDKLNQAFQAWKKGARIIATNPDRTCPLEDGQVPDCGAIIGAIEGATGEKVDIVLGKPSLLAAKFIVDNILMIPSERCFMVGDRLETDIKMGIDYGLNTILVLTGVTDEVALKESSYKPNFTLNSIKDILNLKVKIP
ncbi:HAD-IIA family hydrolase [Lentibacillus sp. N15]|uniref:HAD-IIA family hydrolase n=1 Tax=Lentibacillus songyuanensis TaxID=3136161 RepID=UPI0031BAC66E